LYLYEKYIDLTRQEFGSHSFYLPMSAKMPITNPLALKCLLKFYEALPGFWNLVG